MDIPERNKGGDCYQVAYRFFMSKWFANKNLRLVHGLVTGQGKLEGIVYNHAWVEDVKANLVYDMTMPKAFQILPKDLYYRLGRIDDSVFIYNHKQAMDKSMEYQTYGPWEMILSYFINQLC